MAPQDALERLIGSPSMSRACSLPDGHRGPCDGVSRHYMRTCGLCGGHHPRLGRNETCPPAVPASPPVSAKEMAAYHQGYVDGVNAPRPTLDAARDSRPVGEGLDVAIERLTKPTTAEWVHDALVDVVAEAWDLNATLPDLGDGDPLSDLDDAIGTLAERLGIASSAPSQELRDRLTNQPASTEAGE